MRRSLLIGALLISGCTVQGPNSAPERVRLGMYPNYRVMLQGEVYRLTRAKDWAKCAGDAMVANVTPVELERLDRYAHGEETISHADLESIDGDLRERFSGKESKEALRPYCPDTVDTFRFPAG